MSTYKCKKEGCDGDVVFDDSPNTNHNTKNKRGDMFLIIVADKPVECSKCGTSYYKHEFES